MKNKQHEYILKAFIESTIPKAVQHNAQELIGIDSIIGGYCTQLINGGKSINTLSNTVIPQKIKTAFSELINHSIGEEKNELIVYYRLSILVETILSQYQK